VVSGMACDSSTGNENEESVVAEFSRRRVVWRG